MKHLNRVLLAIGLILTYACKKEPVLTQRIIEINTHKNFDSTLNAEAREDSIEMAMALAENQKISNIIWATAETEAVESAFGEDAADDPAIWVNPYDPLKSLVLGTQKKSGLYVYGLDGKTEQFIPAGSINNVDLRSGFNYNGKQVALVAGSNRSLNTISLFYIDQEKAVLSDTIANIKSSVNEVYGICMYRSPYDKGIYIFVNGKGGKIEQWKISAEGKKVKSLLVREFYVSSQPEGMVANDSTGVLYLGVEEQGICRISAEPGLEKELIWLAYSTSSNPFICYDIEGLSIYYGAERDYLVASSQGNFSYAIWELEEKEEYLTSFTIWELNIDGVEETDGLDITSIPLGPKYPKGLMVVQDGFNFDGDSLMNQNFKYVSWDKIDEILN